MAFGTMAVVLGTWGLQAAGIGLGPAAHRAAGPAAGHRGGGGAGAGDGPGGVPLLPRQAGGRAVVLVIASLGVMFVYNALTRFVIGTDDQRFADGERFLIGAREFREMTGLDEGLAIKTTQVITVVGRRHRGRAPLLVPEPHADGQVDAGL